MCQGNVLLLLMTAVAAASESAIHFNELGLSEGIDLGIFTLRFYSLAYLAGIILGYWHLLRMVKAPGAPLAQRHADDLFFYCTLGIILGGRLGYATFYQPDLWTGWTEDAAVSWDLLRLWDGGMSFHGGLIGVILALAWVSWRGKLNFLRVADYIAVCVPFGMLFGRLANFVNGELWGRETDVSWAMIFPADRLQLARHPSQLYEAALEGALMIALMLFLFWKTNARFRPGLLVGTFAAGIAAGRFVVEFFREPDAHLIQFAMKTGLSMGQWLTIPLFAVGLFFIFKALSRPPLGSGKPAAA